MSELKQRLLSTYSTPTRIVPPAESWHSSAAM